MNQAAVTGGSGSLGRAIAAVLEAPDWKVLAPSSTSLDVRDDKAVSLFFQQNPVDLLVCAAGVTRDAPIARVSEQAWDEVFAVNFKGSLACAGAALPAMIEKKAGHIIFISSFSAIHPPVGQIAYATAKAALLGLTKDLARTHGGHNIRVNAILPGFIETRMTETVTDERRKAIREAHVLGRFNTPEEVAKFVRHLHHELPHTSGQIFQLDSRVS